MSFLKELQDLALLSPREKQEKEQLKLMLKASAKKGRTFFYIQRNEFAHFENLVSWLKDEGFGVRELANDYMLIRW